MKIAVNRCLDLRYKTQNNTYPVCIRIYYNRKYDYVKTGIHLSTTEYDELHASKLRPALKETLKRVVEVEGLVSKYLNGKNPYDIKLIRQYVIGRDEAIPISSKKNLLSLNIFDWFDEKIEACRKNKQFGSAESYTSTKSVFKDLFNTSVLPFNFFTVEQLNEIQVLLADKRGIEISTIGKHARNLRHIFKLAINEGIISMLNYPFGRYKYTIPEVTQAKKSLSRKMMADLVNYIPITYYEKRAVSYFLFTYFGNGMNLKDIAYLKYKDVQGQFLQFIRKKTRNSTAKLKVIRVIITEEMRSVIEEFGNSDRTHDNYVFPIITTGIEGKSIDTSIHTRNKSINKTLKRVSEKLKFEKIITLGMARHSFANALKQEKVDIAFIQESLGHSSPAITEHYLNSFEDDIVLAHVEKLKNYYARKD